jgi:hypothetical protein
MVAAQSVPQSRTLFAGGRLGRLGTELLNRLDVSKYYVIRTIIILNGFVEGD